jgi:hypothetical protein
LWCENIIRINIIKSKKSIKYLHISIIFIIFALPISNKIMSKLGESANLICEIMTYGDKNDIIKSESKLNSVIEALLIFLDYDDLIDILDNKVRTMLLPSRLVIWHDYINQKINYFRECLEDKDEY